MSLSSHVPSYLVNILDYSPTAIQLIPLCSGTCLPEGMPVCGVLSIVDLKSLKCVNLCVVCGCALHWFGTNM